jgi:hypothetical protein
LIRLVSQIKVALCFSSALNTNMISHCTSMKLQRNPRNSNECSRNPHESPSLPDHQLDHAVTSCHDYPLTSLAPNGQCKWQYNNPPKKLGRQTIRSEPLCPVRLLVHRPHPTMIGTHRTANWTSTRNTFIKSSLRLIVVSMCFFWKGKAKPLWDV